MRCSICNITGTEVKQCMICERDYCNSHFEDHKNCLRPGKEEDAPIVQKAKKLKSNEDLTEKSTKSKDENRSEDCLPIAVEGDSADIEQQNKKQKLKHAESSAKLNEEDRKIEGSVSLNEKNTFNIIDEPILEIHHIDVGQGESTLIRCIPIVIDQDFRLEFQAVDCFGIISA